MRSGNFPLQEHTRKSLHCRFVCEAIMRLLSTIAIVIVSAWIGMHVNPAAAQSFNERFSIIPKANAAEPNGEQVPQAQPPSQAEPTRGSEHRSGTRSFKRS